MHVKTFGISKQSLKHCIQKVCKNDQRRLIKKDDIPGKAINDEKYLSMSILLRFAITVAYNQNQHRTKVVYSCTSKCPEL